MVVMPEICRWVSPVVDFDVTSAGCLVVTVYGRTEVVELEIAYVASVCT